MSSMKYAVAAGLLGVGIAAHGYFAANGFVKGRSEPRLVTVKGLAEREVRADLGFWPIGFSVSGPTLEDSRSKMQATEQAIRAFLSSNEFGEKDVEVQDLQVSYQAPRDNGPELPPTIESYDLSETLLVRSEDVEKLQNAYRKTAELLKVGVVFSNTGGPTFYYTKFSDLKPELLTEATKRAREAADKFVGETGSKIAGLQTGKQGPLEIVSAGANQDDNHLKYINKKVRIVTTLTFFLAD